MAANPKANDLLIPDLDEAERFLKLLDPEAEIFTFQGFDDQKKDRDELKFVRHGSLATHAAFLAQANQRGGYVGMLVQEGDGLKHGNKTCRTKASVKRIRAVFQEDDGDGKPLPLEPQIVVQSSPGKHHRYLLVEGLSRDEFASVMKVMIDRYGSDEAVKDLARVLRLPGFWNQKPDYPEPFRVRIVHESGAPPYTREQILEAFKPEPVAAHEYAPDPEPTESVSVDPEMLRKAKRIALDAAIRTENDPKLGRHGEIFKIGAYIRRDLFKRIERPDPSAEAVILDAALTTFSKNMRPTNPSGQTVGMNWDTGRKAIRDGFRNPNGEPDRPGTRKGDGDGDGMRFDFGAKDGQQAGDTTQPEPLRAPMPKAEPYPAELLGETLGAAAQALHEVIKAPLALCCQSVLGSASLAAQSHFDVKLPWGSTAPLSLFLLTVGESGERKSAVDDIVLGAAKAQEKADMQDYAELMKDHEAASAAWNQALDAAKKAATSGQKRKPTADEIRRAMDECGEKPTPPIQPMRFVTDPTVEGLFKLLAIGQPSVALFSDEGGLLIGGHALNSDNALKTMARWCKLWDGSPFDRVRSGDGSGILYGRRMALHQLAQPDVMVKLLSDPTANGQGFLARCLTAWPTSTIGTRQCDGYIWAGERIEVRSMYGRLKELMEAKPLTSERDPQELTPIALPLSPEAQSLAVEAGNLFENLMATGNDLAELRDRGSKALENACRIAGVLAVVEGGMATREISRTHLDRGVNLIQWYLNEALRIRSAAVVPQSVIDAESMLAWLKDRDCKAFRTATLLTHGPSQLRNKKRLDGAIDEAVQCGYLAEQDSGTEVDGVKAKRSWRVLHYVV